MTDPYQSLQESIPEKTRARIESVFYESMLSINTKKKIRLYLIFGGSISTAINLLYAIWIRDLPPWYTAILAVITIAALVGNDAVHYHPAQWKKISLEEYVASSGSFRAGISESQAKMIIHLAKTGEPFIALTQEREMVHTRRPISYTRILGPIIAKDADNTVRVYGT